MGRVKITAEYLAGIIGGFGVALVSYPLLDRWIALEPKHLSLVGVVLACSGGFLALYAQKKAASARAATHS